MVELSREDKIARIAAMLQNHQTLWTRIFDENQVMRSALRAHLLRVFDVYQKRLLVFFPKARIKDIVLLGSICSYTYNPSSDFDCFAVVENFDEKLQSALNPLNLFISRSLWKPFIFGHPADIGFITPDNVRACGINDYSVLRNEWNSKPIRQEFPFTAEELFEHFCRYSADLHRYVASLEKIDNAFLTTQSIGKLSEHIFQMRNKAFHAKNHSPEREYSLEYNLYRLLKKFGTHKHFMDYINDSQKYNLGKTK